MNGIGAGLLGAAALLAAYGVVTGSPPPGFRTHQHVEWIGGLLFVGAATMLVSGCRSSSRLRILLPAAVVGAFFCIIFPRGTDPNPLPPAVCRYGFPYIHGDDSGCVVRGFPYFSVEKGALLGVDIGVGALLGLGAALWASLLVRPAVGDFPSCRPPSPPRSAPPGSST